MNRVKPELRKLVMTLVDVSWDNPHGVLQRARARMEDKSAHGACIRVSRAIDAGSKVRIQWQLEHFCGVVKYCRCEGRDYLIGIQRDAIIASASNSASDLADAVPAQSLSHSAVPASAATPSPANRQECTAGETSIAPLKAESQPVIIAAINAAGSLPRGFGHISANRERRGELDAGGTQPQANHFTTQTQAGKERKPMGRKWFQPATWHERQDDLGLDGEQNAAGEKQDLIPQITQIAEKDRAHTAREISGFEIELLPLEDVYRATGVVSPRNGYGVSKVIEMVNSAHIRALSKEMKRAAVLMALDAAGVSLDQIQRDAKERQDALDAYEAGQKKQAEAEWARKAEEVTKIQSELESIKAHYAARISGNLEAVARDKAKFNKWASAKQQETRSMAEAVELCKSPVSDTVGSTQPELSLAASANGGGIKP